MASKCTQRFIFTACMHNSLLQGLDGLGGVGAVGGSLLTGL